MLLPVEGNWQQAKRFDAQLAANKPLKKRLWADIVRAKLQQQAAALEAAGAARAPLDALATKVRSGDPENREAQGARRYWALFFGDEFKRDKNAAGINALLNYGYTVLRAATARAVVAAGVHPTLGLHHSNEGNALRLVDDLMEPFRPIIDLRVWHLGRSGTAEVTPEAKRAIVRTLYDDMQSTLGVTPVMSCIERFATSLAQLYLGEREKLELPLPGLPLSLTGDLNGD
jgi:CRISPR-associated protein Cas1